MHHEDAAVHPLSGDRAIEWSYVTMQLSSKPSSILDVGCVGSALAGIASRLGHQVTAVDLREIEFEMPRVTFHRGDIIEMDFGGERFDTIINCSVIEHVGLGKRYGGASRANGDLLLMEKLKKLLKPDGHMILTIPIGLDAIIFPFHRIYGIKRLSKLLAEYRILHEEFWAKGSNKIWNRCDKKYALSIKGSSDHYALGLFLLGKKN
jgi:SAM-dependent methyltransferase